jgi:hypothetical protein
LLKRPNEETTTMRRSTLALACLGIAAVGLAMAAAPGYGAHEEPLATSQEAEPSASALPGGAQEEGYRPPTCDAITTRISAALDAPIAAPLSEDEANEIATLANMAAAADGIADVTCVERVRDALVARPASCGRARQAVTSGLFTGHRFRGAWIAALLEGPCLAQTLPSAQQAWDIDDALVGAVERLTHDREASVREGAWFTLGSLAHAARERDLGAVATRIDDLLAAELARVPAAELSSRLEAAGNAGCARCAGFQPRAARDPDVGVRRAAAAMLRFVRGGAAVAAMCAALSDADWTVRDQAAWALRWGGDDKVARLSCLSRAAKYDAQESVRDTAATSVMVLTQPATSSPALD